MFNALTPTQIEILKTFKFDQRGARRLNAQVYGVVNQIFFDQFYEREVKQFSETLKSAKSMPSMALSKEFMQEYNITGKDALTPERIDVISKDQADATIDLMTREFLKRTFDRHLSMAITHNLSHEATTTYIENILGLKLNDRTQCSNIKEYYESLTPTLNSSVGF